MYISAVPETVSPRGPFQKAALMLCPSALGMLEDFCAQRKDLGARLNRLRDVFGDGKQCRARMLLGAWPYRDCLTRPRLHPSTSLRKAISSIQCNVPALTRHAPSFSSASHRRLPSTSFLYGLLKSPKPHCNCCCGSLFCLLPVLRPAGLYRSLPLVALTIKQAGRPTALAALRSFQWFSLCPSRTALFQGLVELLKVGRFIRSIYSAQALISMLESVVMSVKP